MLVMNALQAELPQEFTSTGRFGLAWDGLVCLPWLHYCSSPPGYITAHSHLVTLHCSFPPRYTTAHPHLMTFLLIPTWLYYCSSSPGYSALLIPTSLYHYSSPPDCGTAHPHRVTLHCSSPSRYTTAHPHLITLLLIPTCLLCTAHPLLCIAHPLPVTPLLIPPPGRRWSAMTGEQGASIHYILPMRRTCTKCTACKHAFWLEHKLHSNKAGSMLPGASPGCPTTAMVQGISCPCKLHCNVM